MTRSRLGALGTWGTVALAAAAAMAACDSPGGGGGGGGVPCAVNPNQPLCQVDAGQVGQDGDGGGVGPGDVAVHVDGVAPGDLGGDGDAAVGDAAVGDAALCAFGQWRCAADGQTVEACVSGAWAPVDTCQPPAVCVDGACEGACQPSCAGAECGPDGCGGVCGTCPAGESCTAGLCVPVCQPDCAGAECGPDGCGGSCGSCGAGLACVQGACLSVSAGACGGAGDLSLLEDGAFAQDPACMTPCVDDPAPGCATLCLQDTYGFTASCANCTSLLIACGVQMCIVQCISDSQSPECLACVEAQCASGFESCAGVPYATIGANPSGP